MGDSGGHLTREMIDRALDEMWNKKFPPPQPGFGYAPQANRMSRHDLSDSDLREQIMEIYDIPESLREAWRSIDRGEPTWVAQDWTVDAGGWRLIIHCGAIRGIARVDEIPIKLLADRV